MKPLVMQLLVTLRMGGAERLALDILRLGKDNWSGLVAGMFHAPGSLAEAAEAQGFPWLALEADTTHRAGGIWRLYKALRSNKVSLLHAQAAYLLPYALPAARLAGVPLVYTEHAVHSLSTIHWLRKFVKLSAPLLQGISCVSEPIREYFTGTIGVSPDRVRCIPNGVDADVFSVNGRAASLPWQPEAGEKPFVFGTVSRLTEAKDHAGLVEAFSIVHRQRPRAKLLLVGDGELRGPVEQLIEARGLRDAVHITGICSEIPERLRSMDVFVLSSVREGLPMALLEAMSCGLPCISTEVGAIGGLNTGGDHIMLVSPGEPERLAKAMLAMMDNASLREETAARGRRHVCAAYGSAGIIQEYTAMYRQGGMR